MSHISPSSQVPPSASISSSEGTTVVKSPEIPLWPISLASSAPSLPDLADMSSFTKYRPKAHFIAPHSWMNDVCGVIWVPETKEYLMCYQWNPGTSRGGNCAWGMAASKDLVTWVDCLPALRNGTDTKYDAVGVFSGSIFSRLVDGMRVLYLFYTSVAELPPNWSVPYIIGSETQSVAISTDFGHSWKRHERNPLLKIDKSLSKATGWRDPYVNEWRNLSELRGVNVDTKYMLVSGGEYDLGSRLIVYESDNLLDWKKVSMLIKEDIGTPIGPGSPLTFERNFECGSFFTFGDGKSNYILLGLEEFDGKSTCHCNRYTLWMSGELKLDADGNPKFEVKSHGKLDYGIFYAPHHFRDSNGKVIASGWADEDENKEVEAQGWAGCITLPRELYEMRVPIPTDSSSFDSYAWQKDPTTSTMTTLASRPIRAIETLRSGTPHHDLSSISNIRSKTFELSAHFTHLTGDETIAFNVRQAPQDREVTKIIITPRTGTITVDRSHSSLSNGTALPDTGPFKLLRGANGALEDLKVHIFVDNSIVEVLANDRFGLTSRVYPSLESALGVSFEFVDGDGESLGSENVAVEVWDDMMDAWPARGEKMGMGKEVEGWREKSVASNEGDKGEGRLQAVEA